MKQEFQIQGNIASLVLERKGEVMEIWLDAEDLPRLKKEVRSLTLVPNKRGTLYPYVRTKDQKFMPLARFLLDAPVGFVADHINRQVWDNRKQNLRLLTHGENLRNSRPRRSKTGRRGVTQTKDGKFIAHLRIGTFETKEEAWEQYKQAVETLFPGIVHSWE